MSDDRLLSALRRLGEQELPVASDRAIRGRLETVWTTRMQHRAGWSFGARRLAPVLAALVLVIAGLGGAAHGAGSDSPLWEVRVALETAGSYLQLSADDRIAYLLDLVQTRTEEAARQEAAGNPAAAAKARAAASSAVVELDGKIPQIETALPTPVPTAATVTPAPANSPSPSPSFNGSSVPAAQLPASGSPSPARTVAPTSAGTPARTEPPRPPTLKPTPSASAKPSMTITGTVRDAAGAPVSGACITTSATIPTSTASCIAKTTNGSYGFSANVAPGQTITLYAYLTTPTGTLAGSATSPTTPSITVMPAITLTPRK